MPHRLAAWSLAVVLAARTTAQSLQGANGTGQFAPDTPKDKVGLLVVGTNDITGPHSVLDLYPLTADWQKGLPADGLSGTILPAASNTTNITQANIAWISCDRSDEPGFLTPVDILERAVLANASAAVLYSQTHAYCNYTSGPDIAASYNRLYSMTSARESIMFHEMFHAMSESGLLRARINLQYKLDFDNATNGSDGTAAQTQQPGGPSPSTAVAMVILYSITGVITALFLAIIVTGAIRAHRHPERYGPRAMLGRARQSRAKGLARAMLDSIPIVKFGDNEGDVPKPADVELNTGASEGTTPRATDIAQPQVQPKALDGDNAGSTAAAAAQSRPSHESVDGILASTTRPAQPLEQVAPALGCSICTEDFERGEDVRVLPCNHKFHPPCIDPWLLNVSGTCPLCRIDLRPPTAGDGSDQSSPDNGNDARTGASDGAGRLGVPTDETAGSRRHSHRLSFIFDPLNRRRMQEATPAERIEALRQYTRGQHAGDESRRSRRRSNRLSALLGLNRDQEAGSSGASASETPAEGLPDSSAPRATSGISESAQDSSRQPESHASGDPNDTSSGPPEEVQADVPRPSPRSSSPENDIATSTRH